MKLIPLFSFAFILFSFTTYSQSDIHNQAMNKFGKVVKLKMNKIVYFDDSLTIKLTHFSHKRSYAGGPTKATAYLSISKDTLVDDVTVSIHGVEGKSRVNDGLSKADRYDSIVWGEYEIQLRKFEYDKSIKIYVLRNEDNE